MRSPFTFFRRHQKVLLAGLGVLAMFGFVILPVIVEGLQVSPARNIVVATSRYGTIRESTLAELMRQRGVMLRFLNVVGEMLIQAGENPVEVQQVLNQIGPATEDAVINRWLLSRYGEKLGLAADQRMINEFIADLTRGKITGPALEEMLERQGVSVGYLFQVLTEELLALRVRELFLTNFAGFTPAQHWDYFQRFNRRVMVETVALPVERFIEQVQEKPQESELRQFFERYRYQVADPDLPEPGFMEPKRVVIEYLKASYDQFVERCRGEITDREIEEYYSLNKDRLYRREPLPTLPSTSDAPTGGVGPQKKPAPSEQQESQPQSQKDLTEVGQTPPESTSPQLVSPVESPPSREIGNMSEDGQSDHESSVETETVNPISPAESPSPDGTGQHESKGSAESEGMQDEEGPMGRVTPSEGGNDSPGEALRSWEGGAEGPPGGELSPHVGEPGDGNGSEGETPPEAARLSATQNDNQPAAAETSGQVSEPQASGTDSTAAGYIPLDNVREEIRSTLARRKAAEVMEQLLQKLQAQLSRFREEKILHDLEMKQRGSTRRPEPVLPDLQALGKAHDLEYKKEGPLSSFDMARLELAQATTALGGQVLEMVFHRLPVFRPTTARDFQGNQYLLWKIEETPSRIPQWEDPGVREKVLRTWQFIRAREIARAEAEKLAAEARKSSKPLADVFADRKDLTVIQSDPFTWLTSPLPLVFAQFERPRISQIKGVDRPGHEFMRTTYQLRAGEVGVAMNHPQTEVYVIRLVESQPPEEVLWQQFIRDPGRLYRIAASDEMILGFTRLMDHIRQQANFQWTPEWQRRRAERPSEWD